MTLDLSEYTVTADSPEVAELKEKVVKVAKKYTDRNGWCEEVQRALAEIGIEQAQTRVNVHVTTTHPFEFDVRMDLSELVGKTDEQQKAAVITKMGTIYLTAGNAVRRSPTLELTPAMITDLSLPPKTGGGWMYASENGRVLHHFAVQALDTVGTWVYSDCNYEATRASLNTTSPRGTGLRCVRCEARQP